MKHWITFLLCGAVWLAPACQPETACHGGRVMSNGSCIFESAPKDAGGNGTDKDAGASADAAANLDAAANRDAGDASDAASMDAGPEDGGIDDAGMKDAGHDAGQVPTETLQCAVRTTLTDEAKYGVACTAADAATTCGSLTCQVGANYCTKSCAVGDACTCPAGQACVSFGGAATACVPTWGRACTADSNCRAQAPLCVEGPNYCTSVCDPANAKTCPDTWSCVGTPGGNFCVKPAPRPVPVATLQCASRTPLTDEDKYGLTCDAGNPGGTCGSLTCQTGANYCTKSCTVGDACSCPGGFACVSFGGAATACVPTWGRKCTSDTGCRAQAPLCAEGPNYCTSVCDPANANTCPDTWECLVTPGGNFCIEKD